MEKKQSLDTICIQGGWQPKNGEPRQLPIYQSTTFKYTTSEQMGRLFDLEENGYFYTRLANPTNDAVAAKICALEGGVGAMLTSSGQAANFYAIMNLCQAGDHVVSSAAIYGGTTNLFTVTIPKMGVECTLVSPDATEEELAAAFRPNTKALFAETIANPALTVLDIEKFAKVAHEHGVPLIVDNTFLSPYLQNPIAQGADLVVHSGTKFLGGHNDTLAGFLCTPIKALAEQIRYLFKTIGSGLSPFDSFLVLRGIKTLSVRVERQQENAMKIASWLKEQKKVTDVYYVGLPEHPGYEINQKQSRGAGSMISFRTDTEETARKVLERVKLISYAESLGGVESLITYPMLQTHGDVPVEIRERLGITETFLRLSVGIENVDDLIADLEQALA